jgi:hypothetical protein
MGGTGTRNDLGRKPVKSGKLVKFLRGETTVHAYIYRDCGAVHAAVYVLDPRSRSDRPEVSLSGATEEAVEADVRAWVDRRFPRPE